MIKVGRLCRQETRDPKILGLRRLGARVETIAEPMECSRTTVTRALRRHGLADKNHRKRGSW